LCLSAAADLADKRLQRTLVQDLFFPLFYSGAAEREPQYRIKTPRIERVGREAEIMLATRPRFTRSHDFSARLGVRGRGKPLNPPILREEVRRCGDRALVPPVEPPQVVEASGLEPDDGEPA
jgi:hypothetical protein